MRSSLKSETQVSGLKFQVSVFFILCQKVIMRGIVVPVEK